MLEIWLADSRVGGPGRQVESRARSTGCALHRVPRRTLERLVGKVSHQGVVCRYRAVERPTLDFDGLLAGIHGNTLLLVLDEVQDPRNLGACLRSAAAAGAGALLVPSPAFGAIGGDGAESGRAARASRPPVVRVGNLADALLRLGARGVRILGAVPDAPESIFECDLEGPLAFVLGGEGVGLRRLTASRCDAPRAHPDGGRGGQPERLGRRGRVPVRGGPPARFCKPTSLPLKSRALCAGASWAPALINSLTHRCFRESSTRKEYALRHYEIVILVHPDQSEQVPAMIERYRSIIESDEGRIHRLEDWGRRQLAYPIAKVHKAHYVLMNIECGAKVINDLKAAFSIQ